MASRACSEASSVIIGCISLVTSGALLLHNMLKLVAFLRRKWCGRREQADARRSGRVSSLRRVNPCCPLLTIVV